MNPKNFKLTLNAHREIDTPYAQIESGSKVEISTDGEGTLQISSSPAIGIKFMSMTVATISEVKISDSGEVLEHKIEAPFLVKKQVENEIFKAVKKIPFSLVERALSKAGLKDSNWVKIEVCADKSVEVESDIPLKIGHEKTPLKSFKICANGKVESPAIDLNSAVWAEFQKYLG